MNGLVSVIGLFENARVFAARSLSDVYEPAVVLAGVGCVDQDTS